MATKAEKERERELRAEERERARAAKARATQIMQDASALYHKLLRLESDGSNAADLRRVLSEERQTLHVRIGRGNVEEINEAIAETNRVLQLWGRS